MTTTATHIQDMIFQIPIATEQDVQARYENADDMQMGGFFVMLRK